MTDRERVEALANWCDRQAKEMNGWTSIGDDAGNRAIRADAEIQQEVADTLRALLRERDAAEALAYERAAEIAEREMKKNAAETYSDGTVTVHRYGQSAAKCYAAGAILEGIRALAPSPNALAEHDAKVRAEERERCAKIAENWKCLSKRVCVIDRIPDAIRE